jgi:hypothetical protein
MAGSQKRILIVSVLTVFCISLSYYLQSINYEQVYTHIFYIPIILACIWWQKKGIMLSLFFGINILAAHTIFQPETSVANDLLRSAIFIIIAIFVAQISASEKNKSILLKKENEEVKNKSRELFEKNIELEKWYTATVGRELKMAELKKQIQDNEIK